MARNADSTATRIIEFFRTGDPAEVKVTLDVVRDIVRKRFAASTAAPKAAKRTRTRRTAGTTIVSAPSTIQSTAQENDQ